MVDSRYTKRFRAYDSIYFPLLLSVVEHILKVNQLVTPWDTVYNPH